MLDAVRLGHPSQWTSDGYSVLAPGVSWWPPWRMGCQYGALFSTEEWYRRFAPTDDAPYLLIPELGCSLLVMPMYPPKRRHPLNVLPRLLASKGCIWMSESAVCIKKREGCGVVGIDVGRSSCG